MLRDAAEGEVVADSGSLTLFSNGLMYAKQMSVPRLAWVQSLPCHWNDHAHYLISLLGQREQHGHCFSPASC